RISDIKRDLEARGIRSNRGNPYSVSSLSNLLKNRKYIGEYKYGDIITPDGIPAIIDKELFERVQMRMAANKKAPARAKAEEEYLLTTKLYCGDCGRLMAGESGKGCKGIVYHYYKCSGAKRRLGCKKKAIKKHWIEEVVVKLTVTKVLTDEAIDRIADAILIMQEQGDTMTPVLKQQLQQCEAEIRNVMKAIRQGIITETTKECLEDLENQRDTLKTSILQLQLERRKFTKEEIVEWISKYKYGNINDLDYRKEIIDTFVNAVFVYDDKLVLTYNYKDGTETLTLQEIESVLSSNLTSMCPPKKQTTHRVVCFFICQEGTRTHSSARLRWSLADTSANTGVYLYFRQRRKCLSSPVVSKPPTWMVSFWVRRRVSKEHNCKVPYHPIGPSILRDIFPDTAPLPQPTPFAILKQKEWVH
ncbi:MAG: recombinase family protein, partial [Oscillospiraceae bacterium]|nr:recombinase family protein [Oscillospiraceae bacterium]